ncbi:MAG: acetylornithine deacetylase [Pseudomonadota bacterium]
MTPVEEILARLVAFDTTSRLSNLALVEFIEAYLTRHGIAARRVMNAAGDKANLYATIGPPAPGGVVLSGHTDVVPVEGQAWSSPPFTLTSKNGRLHGRGACDMKGFIACALALVPAMREAGLKRPIHLAFSYDEEVGCQGAPALIARIAEDLPAPLAVIVGEPTEMRPVNGHKGIADYRTQVRGRAAHSSQVQTGASAVMAAGRLIAHLDDIAEELKASADPASPFEPGHSTLSVNLVNGGTAINILAQDCSFEWDLRMLPGADRHALVARFARYAEDEVLPLLRRTAPQAAIETHELVNVPPLTPQPGGAAEALIWRLTGANRSTVAAFGTEAGQFQEAGFSVIVCGPGAISEAHQPDEFISQDQLAQCETFLRRLIAELSA